MEQPIDVISFKYQLSDNRGTHIESSKGQPVSIIQGKDQVLKAVETALSKSRPGQLLRVEIKSNEAFGDFNENLVIEIPKNKFNASARIGSKFQIKVNGDSIPMTIEDEKDDCFILDGNHPLAGVNLVYEIEVTERRNATAEEIQSGTITANA